MKLNIALAFSAVLLAMPAPSHASSPRVVADIPPVHALAAAVMGDAGAPALAMRPGVSPHHAALRPSEAAALSGADILFWIGPALTPALGRAAGKLAPHAAATPLMAAPGVVVRMAEDAPDPHVWLDPRNAAAMARAMANTLSQRDPEHATTYAANAARAAQDLSALEAEIAETLAPYRGRPFIAAHDSLGYFVERFGLSASAALSAADDAQPGPADIAAVYAAGRRDGAKCVLADAEHDGPLARRIAEELGARITRIDPLGGAGVGGPDGYARMMRQLAGDIADCLGG